MSRVHHSVSVSGEFYARLRSHARARGTSIASLVEQVVARAVGEEAAVVRPSRRYRGPRR